MRYMEKALDFIAQELTSENVEKELSKMSSIYSWIEDDSAATYFELSISVLPECMEKVRLIASKTYTQGLVIIAIYYSSTIYCVLLPGEGDQPLLDVRFPDVSKHNQGVMLNSYNHSEFRKLTLWHNISAPNQGGGKNEQLSLRHSCHLSYYCPCCCWYSYFNALILSLLGIGLFKKDLPKLKTVDLSHKNYEQTYVILHSNLEASTGQLSSYHDVMFRYSSTEITLPVIWINPLSCIDQIWQLVLQRPSTTYCSVVSVRCPVRDSSFKDATVEARFRVWCFSTSSDFSFRICNAVYASCCRLVTFAIYILCYLFRRLIIINGFQW